MRIAVIGSGGREHAILWRLGRDLERHLLFALPGNGGTIGLAQSVPMDVNKTADLRRALKGLSPDLVVVGPEVPLANGITDALTDDHIPCFGPSANAARLESSKVFAKRFMQKRHIPTAEFEVFTEFSALKRFVEAAPEESGWVVKADGLAAGKGAFVCASNEEVLQYSHELLVENTLGAAGKAVVLERKLVGREVSALYLCDGNTSALLPPAQDYKRAEDGDRGPNTGGMGSYSPATHLDSTLQQKVEAEVVAPVLRAMADDGTPYRGVLYVGLMLTDS